ncbi:hypothetical protein HDU88_006959 [Geranomyces variabilis]|nr:hypothetical protein HDU88_006959 [Geranomyces variabilis]
MPSHFIGERGSTTHFFSLSQIQFISWSAIERADRIFIREPHRREVILIIGDSEIQLVSHFHPDEVGQGEVIIKRMMEELAERNDLMAAKSFESRLEELEKQMLCLWNAPGGPGYEAARLEFEELRREKRGRIIGQMGSTTEFFKLDSNRRISWSVIQHAKHISYENYTYVFDDLRVPVRYDHSSADSGHTLTRMMTELSEVVKCEEVLAANKALDKRVEEIEKQIIRLWNAPGGPGYEAARLEFTDLVRARVTKIWQASADNCYNTLKRMMAELAERNNLLAASQSRENRVKKIEKQVLCLWNAPGAPGYETAKLEFEQLQKTNDQKAGESI